jgi:hypothetical protein
MNKELGKGAFGPFLSCGKRLLCSLSFRVFWLAGWLAGFFSLSLKLSFI